MGISVRCAGLAAVLAVLMRVSAIGMELAVETFDYMVDANLHGQGESSGGWAGAWLCAHPSDGYMNQVRSNMYNFTYPAYTDAYDVRTSGGCYLNLAAGFGKSTFNYAQRTLDLSETGVFASCGLAGTNAWGYAVAGGAGGTLWISMLFQCNNNGSQLWLQQQTAADATASYQIAIPNLGVDGQVGLLLACIEYGEDSDSASFWWNPDLSEWSPDSEPYAVVDGDFGFSNFVLVVNGENIESRFDDIRIGTEADDVVPVAAPKVTVFMLR